MKQSIWKLVRWNNGTYGATRTVAGQQERAKLHGDVLELSRENAEGLVCQLNGTLPRQMTAEEFKAYTGHVPLSQPIKSAMEMILVKKSTWGHASFLAGCTQSGILKAMRRVAAANPGV